MGFEIVEKNEIHWMRQALSLAQKAAELGEIPVGAVVVNQGAVVGEGYNLREREKDPLAHAEIIALRAAAQKLGRWRLHGCTLYVTLEPCPMCAGALVNARVDRLVFGAFDKKAGAVRSLYEICTDDRLNHRVEVSEGVLGTEAGALLQVFFRQLREKKNP